MFNITYNKVKTIDQLNLTLFLTHKFTREI